MLNPIVAWSQCLNADVTSLAGLAGIAGIVDGVGTSARFNLPTSVAMDAVGNIYVADAANHVIRKIAPGSAVTTLAGMAGTTGFTDGVGTSASFNNPTGVATDADGNIYVADRDNHLIRKITPGGVVTTLAGSPGVSGAINGVGFSASFNHPAGVTTDAAGNIYVADESNHLIRKITPGSVVTALAGMAGIAGFADGLGTSARFNSPTGVATNTAGDIYVADRNNQLVRKITPGGIVTSVAGTPLITGHVDGVGTVVKFNNPADVATDASGIVYVADASNQVIRKISPGSVVSTWAGMSGISGFIDGTGVAASFNDPRGVATDDAGNVYVGDRLNHLIRKIGNCEAIQSAPALSTSGLLILIAAFLGSIVSIRRTA